MNIHRSIDAFPYTSKEIFLTLGVFDGLHLGHQKIIADIITKSKLKSNRTSVLISFYPHPKNVLYNIKVKYLTTLKEKKKLCQHLGLDHLIIQPFNKNLSLISYSNFIKYLYSKMKIKYFIMGYDNCIGKNREGTYHNIKKIMTDINNSTVHYMNPITINNINVKSSYIKRVLLKGDLLSANEFLGYNYMISGRVIKGSGLGFKLGFPTANLRISYYKFLPVSGVYAVIIIIDKVKYKGMLNIGYRPTISTNSIKRIEVHVFNFQKSLYYKFLYIHLVQFIRKEYKFSSTNLLSIQLSLDKKNIQQLFKL